MGAPPSSIENYLRQKLAAQPEDASTWRLLGRLQLEQGDFAAAHGSFDRALSLQPSSAAARFDLARLLLAEGNRDGAATEFAVAVELAPDSEYAADAREQLERLPPPQQESPYRLAGYQKGNFDGSQRVQEIQRQEAPVVQQIPPPRRLRLRLDAGAYYNSNVALAPTSRELFPGTTSTFQGSFGPDAQYDVFDTGLWRSSLLMSGLFTINQGNFAQLDLQSYRPGIFLERYFFTDLLALVPRVEYEFTHDAFGGRTFGNRNAFTSSLSGYWVDGQATFLYYSTNYTDYLNDGALPAVTSRDGWFQGLGLMHQAPVQWGPLAQIRGGVDVALVNTVGTDYTYNGVSLYGQGVFPLGPRWQLALDAGWGYRDYYAYQFTPSRNEDIWRAGAELRRFFNPQFYVTGQFNYTRFDSKNPLFQAQRYLTGLMATYLY